VAFEELITYGRNAVSVGLAVLAELEAILARDRDGHAYEVACDLARRVSAFADASESWSEHDREAVRASVARFTGCTVERVPRGGMEDVSP
jgi:uncharacterized membrane protein